MRLLAIFLLSGFLLACGGGGGQQRPALPDFPDGSGNILANQRGLVFAYPAREQTEVSTLAPIALRFSHPLDLGGLEGDAGAAVAAGFLRLVDVGSGEVVPFTLTLISEPTEPGEAAIGAKGVLMQPMAELKPNTRYRVQSNDVGNNDPAAKGVKLLTGDEAQTFFTLPGSGPRQLTFTTRSALRGAVSARSADEAFKVARLLPNGDTDLIQNFPLLDFTTLRVQFTQPIDPSTARYAADGTVRLLRADTGALVPARFLVSGNRVVIDPLNDLDTSRDYVLSVTTGLRSVFGVPMAEAFQQSFRPRSTRPASGVLTRNKISVPVVAAGEPPLISLLTGLEANRVPVASEILGRGAEAPDPAAGGDLFTDLGHAPNFQDISPAVLPIRVPANSELTAGTLVVKLGGKTAGVPANLETGTLSIKLISDANGLVLPNRYNRSPSAPALVNLVMDVAVSAEVPTANGDFTQDILHVEVNGIATLDQDDQILSIEALGVVELKILGVDDAIGILSLKLVSGKLNESPGTQQPDTSRPVVQSWVPGNQVTLDAALPSALTFGGGELIRPGDALIVNFSKIMESAAFQNPNAVRLFKGATLGNENTPVSIRTRLDGASLVINADLEHGQFYKIELDDSLIKDLSGNALNLAAPNLNDFRFSLPALAADSDSVRPPVALNVYPGYPCPIAEGSRDLANNIQGRCRGGKTTDDRLPLPRIEQSRDIVVNFSQSIAPISVRQASECGGTGSFRVERVDNAGNCLAVVPGKLTLKPRQLVFTPATPWVKDQLYRYVLGSNNNMSSSDANCLGSQAICGVNGLPLQTQLIAQTLSEVENPKRGGPDMALLFRGGDDLGGANIGLRVLPVTDVDANLTFEPQKGERLARRADGTLCEIGTLANLRNDATKGRCFTANGALLQPDSINGANSGAATQFALGCKSGEFSEDDPNRPAGGGEECQGNQFLLITSALGATLGGLVDHGGRQAVEVLIDPSLVITSGADIFAELGVAFDATPLTAPLAQVLFSIPLLGPILETFIDEGAQVLNGLLPVSVPQPVNTGPLVFRLRFPPEGGPIRGFITEGPDGPILETTLSLYTDIPEINAVAELVGQPAIPINHNVRSNEDLTNIAVRGKVNFLPDGRLTVSLANQGPVRLQARLDGLGGLLEGFLRVYVAPGRFVIDASLAPIKQ